MTGPEIAAIAREIVGKPYRHQGRGGVAYDCAGVPAYVASRLGIEVEDVLGYGRQPVPGEMRAALDANLVRVPGAQMQIGDVVWMRFQAEPQHLAIVGNYAHGGLSLIHAYNGSGLGRVIEHRLDETWAERIVAVWRFPGVEA